MEKLLNYVAGKITATMADRADLLAKLATALANPKIGETLVGDDVATAAERLAKNEGEWEAYLHIQKAAQHHLEKDPTNAPRELMAWAAMRAAEPAGMGYRGGADYNEGYRRGLSRAVEFMVYR